MSMKNRSLGSWIINQISFSIAYYATAHTEESVFIIGGISGEGLSPFIAQYNDDKWTFAGSLKQPRYWHEAITVEGITMILGGYSFTET